MLMGGKGNTAAFSLAEGAHTGGHPLGQSMQPRVKPSAFLKVYHEVMYKTRIFKLACMSSILAESYVQTMEPPCSAEPVPDNTRRQHATHPCSTCRAPW